MRSRRANPPVWVVRLIEQVCTDYNYPAPLIDYRKALPTVIDSEGAVEHAVYSSGRAYLYGANRMRLVAGSDHKDLKHTVLHEMAHLISDQKHTKEFWVLAFELFHRYSTRAELKHAEWRSLQYKKKAAHGVAAMRAPKS